jgi:hypothetical protein
MWDWQCFAKYSSHLDRLWVIFCRIISVPHNTITYLNNVIVKQSNGNMSNKLHAYLVSGFQINCVQYVRDSACHNKASFFAMSTVIFLSRFLAKLVKILVFQVPQATCCFVIFRFFFVQKKTAYAIDSFKTMGHLSWSLWTSIGFILFLKLNRFIFN